MRKPIFTGVCTALVTPFLNGQVNYPMMRLLLKRQIDAGIKAVVVSGTTGEAPTLTDLEKTELIRQCKSEAGSECLVIAGTGSNSTQHSIELSLQAEEAGADALLVVSPYYNKTNDNGLIEHYAAIAHRVSLPVILYNVPSRTGLDIPVHVYKRLSRIPNIVGVKEACPDITKITKIRCACEKDFCIWTGNDDQTVPAMALGAKGVISVASNICPEQMLRLTHCASIEEYETAGNMQAALQPLTELLFCEVNPIPVKAAMVLLGYDCGGCRLPLSTLKVENMERLCKFFQEY